MNKALGGMAIMWVIVFSGLLRGSSAWAVPGPTFAIVAGESDPRCGDLCLRGEVKEGSVINVLSPNTSYWCEGHAGRSFTHGEASEEGDYYLDLTPVTGLKRCPFPIKVSALAIIGEKVRIYKPAQLKAVADPGQIAKANDAVMKTKAVDSMLDEKFKSASAHDLRYTVKDLTEQPPSVWRYPGSEADLLLLRFNIHGLNHSGPAFAYAAGKAWAITDICGQPLSAFELNGKAYLEVSSAVCCECDAGAQIRVYEVDGSSLRLVQVLP